MRIPSYLWYIVSYWSISGGLQVPGEQIPGTSDPLQGIVRLENEYNWGHSGSMINFIWEDVCSSSPLEDSLLFKL